ncbi:MAG: hypothetical protein ACUVX9_13560 [Anaerolineae bacterium]
MASNVSLTKLDLRRAYAWLLATITPIFGVAAALGHRLEERAYDAASYHIHRAIVYSSVRADGVWPPRWAQALNGGFGGPLFTFYSPLVYDLLDRLYLLGIPHPFGWRVITAVTLVAAALCTFGLGLALFRRVDVALACAALVSNSPALLRELFVRGAPQGMAIALYPCLLWALTALAIRPSGCRLALAACSWALIILTHTLAALLVIPVLALFIVLLVARQGARGLWTSLLALAAGFLVAAIFLLPFIAEQPFVDVLSVTKHAWAQPALNPYRLGDILRLPDPLRLSFSILSPTMTVSLIELMALLAGLCLAVLQWRCRQRMLALCLAGFALIGLAILWLQTSTATPVWAALRPLDIIQIRWRLLGGIALPAGLLLGHLLRQLPPRASNVVAAIVAAGCVLYPLPALCPPLLPKHVQMSPQPTMADVRSFMEKTGETGLAAPGEYLPRWREGKVSVSEAHRAETSPVLNLPAGAEAVLREHRNNALEITVQSPTPFMAQLALLYYPGWTAWMDGHPLDLKPAPGTGYATAQIPQGSHTIRLAYQGTPYHRLGLYLSLIALLGLIAVAWVWRPLAIPELDLAWPRPRWYLPVGLVALAVLKVSLVDPSIVALHSSCYRWPALLGAEPCTLLYGDSIHLCGYRVSALQAHPGDRIRVSLYWQSFQTRPLQLNSYVHLLGEADNVATGNRMWAQSDKQLPAELPMNLWDPGQVYEDVYDLFVPASAPPGDYQVLVGLWRQDTGERLAIRQTDTPAQLSSDSYAPLVTISVDWSMWQRFLVLWRSRLHPPAISHPRHEIIGTQIRFLGYDLQPNELKPGDTLILTLYWQALSPIDQSYTVFTHLLSPDGQFVSGHDGLPARGGRRTSRWLPGEVILDVHEIPIPADAPTGHCGLEIGLYDLNTLTRLPAFDRMGGRLEQDRVLLDAVTIR